FPVRWICGTETPEIVSSGALEREPRVQGRMLLAFRIMKIIPALMAASALLIASCTSPIVRRIERNSDLYQALSTRQKELVQQGRIEEGMNKKAVFLAWGKPDRAAKGSRNGREYERWSYADYEPTYTAGPSSGPTYW